MADISAQLLVASPQKWATPELAETCQCQVRRFDLSRVGRLYRPGTCLVFTPLVVSLCDSYGWGFRFVFNVCDVIVVPCKRSACRAHLRLVVLCQATFAVSFC